MLDYIEDDANDILNEYSKEELAYFIRALKMPYDRIKIDLDVYDNFDINEEEFINMLANKYDVSTLDIHKRFKDVRPCKVLIRKLQD